MTDPTPPPAPADHPKIAQFRHQVFNKIDQLREDLQAIADDANEPSRYIKLLQGNTDRCFAHRYLAADLAQHIDDLTCADAPMTTLSLYGTHEERLAIIARLTSMYRDGAAKLEDYANDWRAHIMTGQADQGPAADPAAPDGGQP